MSIIKFRHTYEDIRTILEKKIFQQELDSLAKKIKNKRVLIYGAGIFFSVIHDNYNLDKFNIIGISDQKFKWQSSTEFKGYRAINPDNITSEKFDFLFSALLDIDVIEPILDSYKKKLNHIQIITLYKRTIQEELACADADFEYY